MKTTTGIEGLYAVTPATPDGAWLASRLGQVLAGGARIVQYRGKGLPPGTALRQARRAVELCRAHGALCLINDDIDLAQQVHAHGVHVGREDAGIAAAREVLGARAIIGASCYDQLERAHAAVDASADYVAFGSFHPSRTKPHATRASVELLEAARSLPVPVVAIGGIDAGNASRLIAHGADAIAVISALFDVDDSQSAARAFVRLFEHPLPIETT